MEVTRSTRMVLEADEAESNRIINEVLDAALMTTQLLVAWPSGEADAQVSPQILWEGFCRIRSASGLGFRCDEMQSGQS
jgi:hypothetical protein